MFCNIVSRECRVSSQCLMDILPIRSTSLYTSELSAGKPYPQGTQIHLTTIINRSTHNRSYVLMIEQRML